MKKINYYTILLLSLSTCLHAFGQSIESTGFSPDKINPDDTSVYSVTLKDISGNISGNSIPMPDGLQIVNQSRRQEMRMGTGGTHSQTILQYVVKAIGKGTYTVPEWSVEYQGKTFKIPAATLSVDPNVPIQKQTVNTMSQQMMRNPFMSFNTMSQRTAQDQTQSYEDSLKKAISLEVKIPRDNIYIGETVPCEIVFAFDKNMIRNGFRPIEIMPQIKDANAFDCPAFTEDRTVDQTTSQDKVFVIYHTVITPLKVGTYNLDFSAQALIERSMTLDDDMGASPFEMLRSMMGGRQIPISIDMPAKKINVLELPEEGKPQDFTGAIGKFTLSNVTVEPDTLSVGEPCTLTAQVIGSGNFTRISSPNLVTNGNWKTYKAKSSFEDESKNLGYVGIKTFKITAVPTKADIEFAPKVVFNYFDPTTKKYIEVSSKEISVSVAPTGRSQRAKEEAQLAENPEPTFAKIIDTPTKTATKNLLASPAFWGVQVLILAGIIIIIMNRRQKLRLQNDPAYAKRKNYIKQAHLYLSKALSDANSENAVEFFDDARTALQYVICADTDLEANALTAKDAIEIVRKKNLPPETVANVSTLFEGADALAFGGQKIDKTNLKDLTEKLKETFNVIEKK